MKLVLMMNDGEIVYDDDDDDDDVDHFRYYHLLPRLRLDYHLHDHQNDFDGVVEVLLRLLHVLHHRENVHLNETQNQNQSLFIFTIR